MLEWLMAGVMPTVSFFLSQPPHSPSLLAGRSGVILFESMRSIRQHKKKRK
jgi:hypothetical protein